MFTILPEFEKLYLDHIELGKNYLKDKNLTILGLARNIGNDLYENILSIDNIKKYCNNLSYFIYENDSSDNTPNILDKIHNEINNFVYESETLSLQNFSHKETKEVAQLKSIERTTNLAKHRNKCLNYAKQNYPNTDFIIVMDLDFKQFNLNGILNSFGWFSQDYADTIVGNSFQLKTIFSQQDKPQPWNYDSWAYRGSWWDDLQKFTNTFNYDPMLWFGFWQPPIGSPPIKVNSAFGGIGIYKASLLYTVEYEGYDCEHVCLHKNLYTKYSDYKLCINPSQVMLFL
jgi:hypothetical protein